MEESSLLPDHGAAAPANDPDPGDDAQALARRRNRAAARQRLRDRILLIHYEIHKPLADVVLHHALHYLPARSLLRLRAVASSWARLISSPVFAHTQPRTHRSISGVFFLPPGVGLPAAYSPFPPAAAHALPDPALSFLPASPVAALSSSNGLLLCYAPSSRDFFVCNPVTAAWAEVPRPPLNPGPDPAAVLIFLPDVYNFPPDYSVVVAFEIGGRRSGVFGFQTFSSSAGGWWVSGDVCVAERLYPASGVSTGGKAYWRSSMLTVVGYDPVMDRVQVVPWPMGNVAGARWEIGEMGGGCRLYCTAVTEQAVHVYKLPCKSDEWALVAFVDVLIKNGDTFDFFEDNTNRYDDESEEEEAVTVLAGGELVFKNRPWPLRFQGSEMEVLVWLAGTVVGVDISSKRVRVAAALGGPSPVYSGAKFVPHISTLAPVPPSAADASTSAAAASSPQNTDPTALGGSSTEAADRKATVDHGKVKEE